MSDHVSSRQDSVRQRKQSALDALANIPHARITDGIVTHRNMLERAFWNKNQNPRKYLFSSIPHTVTDTEIEVWLEDCRRAAHIDHTFYFQVRSLYEGWLQIDADDTLSTLFYLWRTFAEHHPYFHVLSTNQDYLLDFRGEEHEYKVYLVKIDDSLPLITTNPLHSFPHEPAPIAVNTNLTCQIVLHEEVLVLDDLAYLGRPLDPQFQEFLAAANSPLSVYRFEARDSDGLLVMQPLVTGKVMGWVERAGFVPPRTNPYNVTYSLLNIQLRKTGWQPTGQYGDKWWQQSFLRESTILALTPLWRNNV